jgi:hypothetical protein
VDYFPGGQGKIVKFHPGQIFATYCREPILTGTLIRRGDIWLSTLAMINPERLKALDRLDCSDTWIALHLQNCAAMVSEPRGKSPLR